MKKLQKGLSHAKEIYSTSCSCIHSFTFEQASASADVVVCAVPQVYSALESAKEESSNKFKTYYAPAEDITSRIANNSGKCSIVISSDENQQS